MRRWTVLRPGSPTTAAPASACQAMTCTGGCLWRGAAAAATPGITTIRTAHRGDRDQPVKIDDDLYVRDYARCIRCYKCVKACGTDAQFTFAIAAAGRGRNCIGVCPTSAQVTPEYEPREFGRWDPDPETVNHHLLILWRGMQP
jgi:ferredoxin